MIKMTTYIMVSLLLLGSCEEGPFSQGKSGSRNQAGDWLIPEDEVVDGGPGKDGIPALELPGKASADDPVHSYLAADDLVLGIKRGDEITAYPHPILDWHEIINDRIGDLSVAITYCPLTGTGIGWDRYLEGEETTFGVSGFLYNSNLIPYDRKTGSNWSQIRLDCVNGALVGTTVNAHQLIEMPWEIWKEMYPRSQVVTKATGHNRSYGVYPYGAYKTSSSFIFRPDILDERLHVKERVLAVIRTGEAKVYRFVSFDDKLTVIHDEFKGIEMVIAGIRDGYMAAFNRQIEPGIYLEFSPVRNQQEIIMKDQEGNEWNVFGEAVSGPRLGQQLKPVVSFMAYWFSIAAFYPDPVIY